MTGTVLLEWVAAAACALAVLPLILTGWNLLLFRRPPARAAAAAQEPAVSVLIPARDEAEAIAATVRAVLGTRGVTLELIVLDDRSRDATAAIVHDLAREDSRVRLEAAPLLPPGWTGKQRACALLAEQARYELLLFLDADVVVAPDAIARLADYLLARPRLGLVSAFPTERTGSWAEQLVIPWIHILLLGYLPLALARACRHPGFGAGCGQIMLARASAYRASGGHGATPMTRHDGVMLPRTFRSAGWMTDVVDAHRLASCRMYANARQLWDGFVKNADEGLGTPVGIWVWSVLLLGGHVLPWLLWPLAEFAGAPVAEALALAGVSANLLLRILLILRFDQPAPSALVHPLGCLAVLAMSWTAWGARRLGRPAQWRGRSYPGVARPPQNNDQSSETKWSGG